jgi:hypothetical protein
VKRHEPAGDEVEARLLEVTQQPANVCRGEHL